MSTMHRVTLIAEINMKFARTCLTLASIVIVPSSSPGQATAQPKQSGIESANRLFQVGKFAEAEKLYSQIVTQKPKDYSATLQLGRIALLSNRLDDAQKWLEKAITLKPGDADPKVMLAEVFYRRDDFQKAAASLKGVDVKSNKLIIEQYPTLTLRSWKVSRARRPMNCRATGQVRV